MTSTTVRLVFEDPANFTIEALSQGLRDRRWRAEDIATEVIARCARHAELHALISQDPERLLAAARAADRRIRAGAPWPPLLGIPVFIKDNIDTADYPTTAGTPGLAGDVPKRNAPVVDRLLAAGALVAGKTNLHELAVGGTSHNLHFGHVRSPWRDDVIAGGSSGGSAAAVAARFGPAALGTDTNGSVRGPCSLSGIAGFRPTAGRYPGSGVMPPTPTRDSVGVMATSCADLAVLDGVLAGEPVELEPVELDGLRFGKPAGDFCEAMDSRTAMVIDAAVLQLREAGAEIIEADLPGLKALTARAAWVISGYEVVREMPRYLRERGTDRTIDDIVAQIASPVVRERFRPRVADLDALRRRYDEAMNIHRPALQTLINGYFAEHSLDAIVFATTPFPAPPLADDTGDLEVDGHVVKNGYAHVIQNTVHQSAAGIPSVVVPAGLTDDGLPVGLSFDAPARRDRRLLAIAAAYERIRGAFPRPPLADG